jgi:hypothetical protein
LPDGEVTTSAEVTRSQAGQLSLIVVTKQAPGKRGATPEHNKIFAPHHKIQLQKALMLSRRRCGYSRLIASFEQ